MADKHAKTEPEVQKPSYKLMARDTRPAAQAGAAFGALAVRQVPRRTKETREPDTWKVQFGYLTVIRTESGKRLVDSLKGHEVNGWLDTADWGGSTKGLVVHVVKAVFNCAVVND